MKFRLSAFIEYPIPSLTTQETVQDRCRPSPPKKLPGSRFSSPYILFCSIYTINSGLNYFPVFTHLSEPVSISADFRWMGSTVQTYRNCMGKTQKGQCERSFGTNVLVLAINATTFSRRPKLLKRTSTKMSLWNEFRIRKLCSRNQPCHERDHCS